MRFHISADLARALTTLHDLKYMKRIWRSVGDQNPLIAKITTRFEPPFGPKM